MWHTIDSQYMVVDIIGATHRASKIKRAVVWAEEIEGEGERESGMPAIAFLCSSTDSAAG